MNLPRRHLPLALIGLAAALAGALAANAWLPARHENAPAALWDARLTDLSGKTVGLDSLRGRPLLINFWATWCGPCKEEMPDIQRLAAGELGAKLAVVGIGIDDPDKLASFSKEIGITYQILQAGVPGLDLMKSLGNRAGALPFTLVLDAAGRVVTRHTGKLTREQLLEAAVSSIDR
jgi:thiol-disulfide isomerase/thioredoxin